MKERRGRRRREGREEEEGRKVGVEDVSESVCGEY